MTRKEKRDQVGYKDMFWPNRIAYRLGIIRRKVIVYSELREDILEWVEWKNPLSYVWAVLFIAPLGAIAAIIGFFEKRIFEKKRLY